MKTKTSSKEVKQPSAPERYGATTAKLSRKDSEEEEWMTLPKKLDNGSRMYATMPSRNTVAFARETTPLTSSIRSQSNPASSKGRRTKSLASTQGSLEDPYISSSDRSALFGSNRESIFPDFHDRWLPDVFESEQQTRGSLSSPTGTFQNLHQHHRPKHYLHRSIKRRMFLFLSEPTSSKGSAIFYLVVILAILTINIVMVMQTMNHWQFTPDDCISCGGLVVYAFEDDSVDRASGNAGVPCQCPPAPKEWTNHVLKWLIYFFTVEWLGRVLLFEPPIPLEDNDPSHSPNQPTTSYWRLWLAHLTDPTTILDALAIFPFYLESIDSVNGLMSLRLLRLFRVFQLVRLGQYNTTFMSLTNVMYQAGLYLRILMIVLVFGAALFGSLMYWLEKGTWQYHEASESYRFLRIGVDGVTSEPSPFTSIPVAFWWFMVTATTVGYGDVYPTSTAGKWVALCAMMVGVMVIAFPVSVFSDLWAREIETRAISSGHASAYEEEDDEGRDTHQPLETTFSVNDPKKKHHRSVPSDLSAFSNRAVDADTLWSSIGMQSFLHNKQDDVAGTPTTKDTAVEKPIPGVNGSDSAPGMVSLQPEDLQEILARLESIRENETRIRSILGRYYQ